MTYPNTDIEAAATHYATQFALKVFRTFPGQFLSPKVRALASEFGVFVATQEDMLAELAADSTSKEFGDALVSLFLEWKAIRL